MLDSAAEHVFSNLPDAYEILIESIESMASSGRIKDGDTEYEMISDRRADSRLESVRNLLGRHSC